MNNFLATKSNELGFKLTAKAMDKLKKLSEGYISEYPPTALTRNFIRSGLARVYRSAGFYVATSYGQSLSHEFQLIKASDQSK